VGSTPTTRYVGQTVKSSLNRLGELLISVALVVTVAFLGFVVGGLIGAQTVPPDGAFAAGATVFVYGAGGALIACVAGVVAAARLSTPAQLRVLLMSGVTAAAALGWFVLRMQ